MRRSHVWGDKVADQAVAHGEAHMAGCLLPKGRMGDEAQGV